VIARTSAIQYKKTTKVIPEIGKELGADYLIEGTVRWEKQPGGPGRVRITPQLVRARDGTHVWADQYDKVYGSEIFDMQSDIAERVANALSVTLIGSEQKAVRAVPTTNLQAYDFYLRGRAYTARDFGQDWQAQRLALESYEQAEHLDSTFAPAYAWAAYTHWMMHWAGYDLSLPTGVTGPERLEMLRQAAERAVGLDGNNPVAHVALGHYYDELRDTARSLAEFERAERGDPNDAEALEARGQALIARGSRCRTDADGDNRARDCGRQNAGFESLERAASLDPRNPQSLVMATMWLGAAGYDSVAEAHADRAIAVSPDLPQPYGWKAWLELMRGHPEQARATLHDGIREVGLNKFLFSLGQHVLFVRFFRIFRDEYGPLGRQLSWDAFGLDSLDYYSVKAEVYRADQLKGPAYFDSLAAWAAPRARSGKELDAAYPVAWIAGLAGSGKREPATREIARLLADNRYVWHEWNREGLAEACMMVSLYDCAVEQLKLAMNIANVMNPTLLKVDQFWDPIRGRADFQQLLEAK
jgi:tetratricopeptide (TPR) repeat protein